VGVVPGDEAADRVPDPRVRRELLFQQVQDAKRRVADLVDEGDLGGAQDVLRAAGEQLAADPGAAGGELAEEAEVVARLAGRLSAGDAAWSAKMSRMEHHRKARRRGRRA
jgi:Ca-activated chloride channel family protein